MTSTKKSLEKNDGTLLLQAVQATLSDMVLPQLSGYEKYHTRIAMNLLSTVMREQQYEKELKAAQHALADFVKIELLESGEYQTEADLTEQIKSGEISATKELLRCLKNKALIQMKIDNPKYWGYLQAEKEWAEQYENESD